MSDAVESKPKPLMNSASFGTNKGGSMAFSRTNIDDITKILGFINEEVCLDESILS